MDYVGDLLKKHNISYTVSGKDYVTRCLNPEHDDKHPSLRIDKTTGATNCFSCGFKANIFKHFGVTGSNRTVKLAKLKQKLEDLNLSFNGAEFSQDMIPYTKPIRDISVKTLKEFGAFYTLSTKEEKLIDRIFFPIKDIRGKTAVFVGRHLYNGTPKYYYTPRHTQIPIFPSVMQTKARSVVLVEGIFDLLNLWDKGLTNVACVFGVNTLESDTAMKMLPFQAQGVEKIYLMFDGDEAGRKGMDKAKPALEEAGYLVEIINLEDNTDPGNLSQEYVDSIKEYISDKDNSVN